jgi:hypothetical protein
MVANVEAMSDFDDPQAWMRQFEGTAGQPLLQEAFGILSNVRYRMTLELSDGLRYGIRDGRVCDRGVDPGGT